MRHQSMTWGLDLLLSTTHARAFELNSKADRFNFVLGVLSLMG